MKKIVVETNLGKETMIINTALIAFLNQFNNGDTTIHFVGGGSLSISPDLDIEDVYTLLFYEGKHLKIGNIYSEELPKK